MAKHRKKRRLTVDNKATNSHHLCWPKRCWAKNQATNKLRNHPYCIVDLPQNTVHRHIHENMRGIPVPMECTAENALIQLQVLEEYGGIKPTDPIERRLMVLAAIFDKSDQDTANAFRQQFGIVCGYKVPK